MGLLSKLFGGKSAPKPPKRVFDPTILQNFERQIATWPADQASAALHVIRSTLTGDQADLDQFFGKLTVAQLRVVNEVASQIHRDDRPVS